MTDYSALKKQLLNNLSKDKSVQSRVSTLNKKIKGGSANFGDVTRLATDLSKAVSRELTKVIPDEEIGTFAEEVISPIYTASQKTILNAGKKVQKGLLEKSKMDISPAEVKTDVSRIQHIVGRFREAESIDTVSFLVGQDVAENVLKSAVTDTIKGNARQLTDMGFETYVTRSDGAGCCDWCASMVGTYKIDDLPDDFWAVHKGCTCTFEYKSKDTHQRIAFSTDEKGNMKKETTNI